MLNIIHCKSFDRKSEKENFDKVFSEIRDSLGDKAFCKYIIPKKVFSSQFLLPVFEIFAMGLGHTDSPRKKFQNPVDLKDYIINNIWLSHNQNVSKSGESAVARLPRTLKFGREIFEA
jgi:hypothetical protein